MAASGESWIGRRFGRLCVFDGPVLMSNGLANCKGWICKCDCGATKSVRAYHLKSGKSQSCGCLVSAVVSAMRKANPTKVRHGHSHSPTYRSWYAMRDRCGNSNNKRFDSYGGRGITVCDRWALFDNFLSDMGVRPEGKTIDRINVNGNYEPSNCRWATAGEQAQNKRNSRQEK